MSYIERNQLVDLVASLASDAAAAASLRLGQRVFVRGLLSAGALLQPQSGIVRHIGPVHWREKQDGGGSGGHQGSEICGVELDAPILNMRGTGNGGEGTVDNVTYFITAKPRSAVFVRPSDVTPIDPVIPIEESSVSDLTNGQDVRAVVEGSNVSEVVSNVDIAPVDTNLLVRKGLTGSLWSRSRQVQNQQLQSTNYPQASSRIINTNVDPTANVPRPIPAAASEKLSENSPEPGLIIAPRSEGSNLYDKGSNLNDKGSNLNDKEKPLPKNEHTSTNNTEIEESVPISPPSANQRTFSPLQAFDPSSLILRVSEALSAPSFSDDHHGNSNRISDSIGAASAHAVKVTLTKKSSSSAVTSAISRKTSAPTSALLTKMSASTTSQQTIVNKQQAHVKAPTLPKSKPAFSDPADVVIIPSNRRGISYGASTSVKSSQNKIASASAAPSAPASSGMRTYILSRGGATSQVTSSSAEYENPSSSPHSARAGRSSSTPPGGKPIFKTMIGRSSSVPPSAPSPSLESSEREARAKEKEEEKLAAKIIAASRTETSSPPKLSSPLKLSSPPKPSSPPKLPLLTEPVLSNSSTVQPSVMPVVLNQESRKPTSSSSTMTNTTVLPSPRFTARASSPRAFGRSASPRFAYDQQSSGPSSIKRNDANSRPIDAPVEASMTRRSSISSSRGAVRPIVKSSTALADFPPSYRSLRRKSISTPLPPPPAADEKAVSTVAVDAAPEEPAVNLSEAQVLSGKLSPPTPSRRSSIPQPLPTEGLIDPAMSERAYRGLGNFGRLLQFELGSDLPTAVWQSNLRGQSGSSNNGGTLGESRVVNSPSKGSPAKSALVSATTHTSQEAPSSASSQISQLNDTSKVAPRSVSPSSTHASPLAKTRASENYSGPKLSTAQFLRLSKADSLVSVVPSPQQSSATTNSITASSNSAGSALTIEDAHVVISRVAESLSNRRSELLRKLELQKQAEKKDEEEEAAVKLRDKDAISIMSSPLSALEKLVRTTIADVFDETKSSAVMSLSPPQISGTAKKSQKGSMSITPAHGRSISPGGNGLTSSSGKASGIGHGRAVEIVTDKRILLSPRKPQSPVAAGKHPRSMSHGPLLSRPLSPPAAPTPRRALRPTKKEELDLQSISLPRQSPAKSSLQTSPPRQLSPVSTSAPALDHLSSSLASSPKASSQAETYAVRMYAGICEMGYNESNPNKPCQDAVVMHEHTESDACMLAVFDGHGDDGHIIAEYMRDHLPSLVFNHAAFNTFIRKPDNIEPPPKSPEEAEAMLERARSMKDRVSSFPVLASYAKGEREADLRRDVETALKDSLKKCEMQLLSNRDVDCNLSGCTACVAVICGNHLTIANIGDSRAMLLRVPPKGTPGGRPLFPSVLTIDHKPSLPGETKRILLAGGRVKAVSYEDGQDGPVRVWCNDQDLPGLSMSRSVCDVLGKRAGVSSAPDFYSYTLNAEDAYIVIASDGLWEFINAVDVADVVAATALEAHDELIAYEANGGDKSGKDPPLEHIQLALDRLADAATRRFLSQEGYADDVSIIIAEIVKKV